MTILWLRTLISHIWSSRRPNSRAPNIRTPNVRVARPKNRSAKNWALVALAGILAVAGLEGYALSLGIDGTALRAALTSIGVLGGAGFGRVLR